MLSQLLRAPVQVADDRVAIDDQLAVEFQHNPQHAMGTGVLWAHVESHQALAGLQRDVVLNRQRAHGRRVRAEDRAGFVGSRKLAAAGGVGSRE
jgi:hypothetical protein